MKQSLDYVKENHIEKESLYDTRPAENDICYLNASLSIDEDLHDLDDPVQ